MVQEHLKVFWCKLGGGRIFSLFCFSLIMFVYAGCTQPEADQNVPPNQVELSKDNIAVFNDSFTLNWTAPDPGADKNNNPATISEYRVVIRDKMGTEVYSETLTADVRSVTVENLEDSTEYTYEITTTNSLGKVSVTSGTIETKADLTIPPGQIVIDDNDISISHNNFYVKWTVPEPGSNANGDPAGISEYMVSVKDKDGKIAKDNLGNDINVPDLSGDKTEFSLANLSPNTEYVLEVILKNSANQTSVTTRNITTISKIALIVKDYSPKIQLDTSPEKDKEINGYVSGLNEDKNPFPIGSTAELEVLVNDSPGDPVNFTFSSNDENVASVDSSGNVTGKVRGKVIITANNSDSSLTSSLPFEFIIQPGVVTNIMVAKDPNKANGLKATWDRPGNDGSIGNNLVLAYIVKIMNKASGVELVNRNINDLFGREIEFDYDSSTVIEYEISVSTVNLAGVSSPTTLTFKSDQMF